jgi:hypothetical protein
MLRIGIGMWACGSDGQEREEGNEAGNMHSLSSRWLPRCGELTTANRKKG